MLYVICSQHVLLAGGWQQDHINMPRACQETVCDSQTVMLMAGTKEDTGRRAQMASGRVWRTTLRRRRECKPLGCGWGEPSWYVGIHSSSCLHVLAQS